MRADRYVDVLLDTIWKGRSNFYRLRGRGTQRLVI